MISPRLKASELFLEIALTQSKHIVVEGRTDQRFIRAWLNDVDGLQSVAVTPVDNLDVDLTDDLHSRRGDGNRTRVIALALQAASVSVDMRCVADRDLGQDDYPEAKPILEWTDFPALESYAMDPQVLEKANLLSFQGLLPDGDKLAPELAHALRELFAARRAIPHLSRPNYAAGVGKLGLKDFNVQFSVAPHHRSTVASASRPSNVDPRHYAYGHDIAELLMAAFPNQLKNKAGLRTLDAVEGAIRSAIQATGRFAEEGLFVRLRTWLSK